MRGSTYNWSIMADRCDLVRSEEISTVDAYEERFNINKDCPHMDPDGKRLKWQSDFESHNALCDLLPRKWERQLRKRRHNFLLPKVGSERFKRSFIHRCLFNFV